MIMKSDIEINSVAWPPEILCPAFHEGAKMLARLAALWKKKTGHARLAIEFFYSEKIPFALILGLMLEPVS